MFSTAYASCLEENIIKNEFLVVTSKDVSTNFSTKTGFDVSSIKRISSSKRNLTASKAGAQNSFNTYLVSANSLSEVQERFPNSRVQSNCKVQFFQSSIGSDPLSSFQNWYFNSLNQSPSLSLTPLREVVVAVSDTGVDTDHIDLQGNLWTNLAELNGSPGVDDDQNGYIDDVHGYDFGDNDSNPKPSFSDSAIDYDHGTHVAGLIAARSFNNEGASGVSLNSVKVMALKGFKSNAPATISDLLETIYYAVDNGADVINASWGTEKLPEAAEIAAVNYAIQNGVIIVAAAGNDRIPASWLVPAGIKNVVTVASVNSSNELSTFSNYGDSVDFISPGGDGSERSSESLLNLGLGSNYIELRGTSMAAPLVAGLIGALMSQSTSITSFQAVHILKESGNKFTLKPYLQSNNSKEYLKPNFLNALTYLSGNQNIPDIQPELEDVSSYSRDLASTSGSSGGCSNSLSGQSYEGNSSFEGGMPLISIFFFLMPILTLLGIKKGL
ncbi:MAG: S8 family serine peptidase [Bdellovibrionales bacterium]